MQSAVFFQGLAVSAGLIVAIGAQNAFVLAQGVRGAHRLQIALACASSDALLIALGVGGAGALIASQPALLALARWGGAAFLLVYAAMALRRAWHGESMTLPADSQQSVWRVLLATLAVTWLNPHVYLDTVVLLGGGGGATAGARKVHLWPGRSAGLVAVVFCSGLRRACWPRCLPDKPAGGCWTPAWRW
ncbi:MAG: LysE family transporter [Rivihabitans pingtungensis]